MGHDDHVGSRFTAPTKQPHGTGEMQNIRVISRPSGLRVVLVHNHPSGVPTPSHDDIEMTHEVQDAARALSIVLHDHIIVGHGNWLSFRREGLLN